MEEAGFLCFTKCFILILITVVFGSLAKDTGID
jgi:hypothetical protein